ncbi:MAG: chitobiase/beta-hexosaminidase C-terminal domain-containing protein, partial [Prevotella sp.]|nr:chitobiase/beta-hexosaminidase C-terminal domain-containing protein [Prevotella sp.]
MKAIRLRLLLLFLSIAGSVSVWADTVVRFTFNEMDATTNMTLVESGEVKLLFNEASGKNKPRTDGNYAYFYKGNTLNITASGHPIKQVVFKSPNDDTRLTVDCFTVGVRTTTSTALTWSCNGVNYYTLDVEQVRSTLRKFSYIEVTYDESVTFDKPAPPVFSIPEGEVTVGTQVDITSDDGGASIYYTTDGTAPTTSSTKGNSVVIDKDMTIRAIAVMFDVSSDVAEATYTISTEVTRYDYVKVTDVSTLKDGDVVIIVNETASKAMGKDAGNYRNEVDVTISGDKVLNPSDEVEEVTLESTSKLWYLLTPTGYLYADQKTSNYVKTSTSKQGNFSKASIAIQNGNAIIQFQGGGTYNSYLQYYGGTQRFSCYYNNASSPDRQIQLYRKVVSSEEPAETVDLVIREIGYASLYYSDKALI